MTLLWTLAATATVGAQAPSASDYFPTAPGTRWVYEDQQGRQRVTVEDRAEAPVAHEGGRLYPIATFQENQRFETTYYRLDGDAVLLAGFDPKRLLERAYPILKATESSTTWTFSGTTVFMQDPVPLVMRGSARFLREVEWNGRRAPGIEVKLEASVEAGPGMTYTSNQTAVYMKGVGLTEMRETSTNAGRDRQTRTRKLVDFSAPESRPASDG